MRMVFTDRNVRRIFVLALFLGLLFLFRHLAVLLVFFVLFERALGTGARWLNARFQVPVAAAVLGQVVLAVVAVAVLSFFGYTRVVPEVPQLRGELEAQFHHLREWLHARGWEHTVSEHATRGLEGAQHYAGNVVGFLGSVGKSAVYVVIGLILSVVFLIENQELERWREALGVDSPARILMRYFSYLCDAIAITAKLQVIVALVNTLLTLPVLVLMGFPSIPALMVFLFVMGLIPVVGGLVSGVVMAILAYTHKGAAGVGIFFASTFVLHKIESYYLSPRLTAQHVKLPGFVIITSLILFEHVFGLVGLFLSFPSLYVAAKIRESWRDAEREHEDETRLSGMMRLSREPPAPKRA
jgi:predicted PurR-regulated permease PerM